MVLVIEVRAPRAELDIVEVLTAKEKLLAKAELKSERSGSELAEAVRLTRADDEPYTMPEELELKDVPTPEAALVTRTEVANVDLMYGASVEAVIPGVSVQVLVEVVTPAPDEAPHVTVWLLMTTVVKSPLAEEVAILGSEGAVELA